MNNKIYVIAKNSYEKQLYGDNLFHDIIKELVYTDIVHIDEEYIRIIANLCQEIEVHRKIICELMQKTKDI